MSKRSIESEDYNNSKKPKINENSDYIRCSPLLFFDDHVSNQDNANNNVITEMFSDNISEKNIEDITNGFSHSQGSEKLVDTYKHMENYEENGICQLLNSEIVSNCDIENVNPEIVNYFEMENINSEILNNCNMENVNSEIVNNSDVGDINSEIGDNVVKVDIIFPNVTESIIDTTQVASREDESLTLVEALTSHQNETSANDLRENHDDEKILIEEISETLNNGEDHMILKDNSDSLNENKLLPNESEDLPKVSIGTSSPKPESAKSGFKLENSSTDLEFSNEMATSKEEKSPLKVTNTPLNKRGRPKKIISEESPKNIIMQDINNNETNTFKRRVSARIESRIESQLKEEKVDNIPKKIIIEESQEKVIIHDFNNNDTSTVKRRLSARIESKMESQLKEKVENNPKKIISEESSKNVIRDINNNQTSTVKRRLSTRIESRIELELKEVKVDNNPKKNSRVSSKENKTKSIDLKDPGTWPLEVPDDLKIEIIKKGPPKMEFGIFPKNENNRCFAPGNYFYQMSNGEKGRRFWLVYSRSQDAAYCFACRLFKPDHSSTLANVGFTNWKKLNERLINHDTNVHHWSSLDQWSQLLMDNDNSECDRVLTNEQALSMVMLLKNFLSKKSNYTYLLANELENELENYVEDSQMNPKQE